MSDASFVFTSRFLAETATATHVRARALNQRVRDFFLQLTREIDPSVTLEVGAFEAGFSLWAQKHLSAARVVAFEANPYTYEIFRDEVTSQGVEYVNACIGPVNGMVTLNVPRDFKGKDFELGMNQMASLNNSLVTENHERVEVQSLRLDDAIALGRDDRLVAWIDVEGALEQVLSGSRETLSRACAVFVEVESEPIWEKQWLDLDVARWFADIGMVPILRDMQRPGQYNVVFVNQELARDPATAQKAARVYTPPPPGSADSLQPASAPHVERSALDRWFRPALKRENERLREQNRLLRRRLQRIRKRYEQGDEAT